MESLLGRLLQGRVDMYMCLQKRSRRSNKTTSKPSYIKPNDHVFSVVTDL